MSNSSAACKVAVVGIGNLLLHDEGLGVHAVRRLEDAAQRKNVTYVDGGTDPWAAFSQVEDCEVVLVLDAILGGGEPGDTYKMSLQEVEAGSAVLSLHGVTMFHLLQYEALVGNRFEEVLVLGMEPESVEPGIGLSGRCEQSMPEFLEAVVSEIDGVQQRLAAY
ncbi:MAG: hydrogenase maturation protease [Candidatus Brocadiia bacterium]